ncbi:MAG: FAD-binding oxidoreductase [Pseudomonadota bacterium]
MIAVARQPVDTGVNGWQAVLPDRAPQRPLSETVTADLLIIGGGFAGLAALRRFNACAPEATAVLLEARAIGAGPAGRNSGFMIDLPHDLASNDYAGAAQADRTVIAQNRRAIDFALAQREALGMPAEAAQAVGKVNGAATAAGAQHNREYAAHLASIGEPSERLDAAAMQALTGSTYYRDGLYTPGTAMLQPALYNRLLADGTVAASGGHCRVFEHSGVQQLERVGNDWCARTATGQVTAPRVVLAVNGHAASFGFYPKQLLHVFTYASMTRALSPAEVRSLGGETRWSLTPSDPMGTTVRRVDGLGGARIVVRNRFTCDPSMAVSEDRIERVGRVHDRSFLARFPGLAAVPMQYRWGGRLCVSWNGVPAFAEPEPGLQLACCQNGLGAARGTVLGIAAAERAARRNSELADQLDTEAEPRQLPPEPLASLGANAVMRWKEWRAGREF